MPGERPRLSVRTVASAAVIAVAIAVYVMNPILDQRIPEVFRHIDWVSYSRAAQRFLDGQSIYIPEQLAGPYEMARIAGINRPFSPASFAISWSGRSRFFWMSLLSALSGET